MGEALAIAFYFIIDLLPETGGKIETGDLLFIEFVIETSHISGFPGHHSKPFRVLSTPKESHS